MTASAPRFETSARPLAEDLATAGGDSAAAPALPAHERLRVARVIARLNIGGPARHCALLGNGFARRGAETVLYTGRPGPGERELPVAPKAGFRIERVPGLGPAPAPFDDLRALLHLARAFRRQRPHVVHTHTAKAGALGRLAARLAGVPVVLHTFHGHVLEGYFGPLASAAARAAERALARTSQRLLTLSPRLRDELVLRLRVAPPERFEVVPLGRELDELRALDRRPAAAPLRAALGLPPHAFVVGYVGRLAPVKRVPLLVEAFARLAARRPEAHLLVVGDGGERARVEAAVDAHGLRGRVLLLGWREDLPAVYRAIDVLALASRNEGTPLSVIEAFAAGVPAVAPRVGGLADMFSAQAPSGLDLPAPVEACAEGALVPEGDVSALALALEGLAGSPGALAACGEAARRASGRWSAERLLDALWALYHRLLAEVGSR
ncbi:MAG: glycosyltransferase family 1 protein [Planctomycetota bacterium]|nr:MAG: glycosyltransferase family 1 protein [Planctomycetota bacterium]